MYKVDRSDKIRFGTKNSGGLFFNDWITKISVMNHEFNSRLTRWNACWFLTRPWSLCITSQIPGSDKRVVITAGVINCRFVAECLLSVRYNMVPHTSILYHTGMLTLHSLSRSDRKGIKDHFNMHDTRYENKAFS